MRLDDARGGRATWSHGVLNARLALRFGVSLARYATGAAPAPFSASFAVTDRCNLACSYCACPDLDPTALALPDVARVLDRLRALGVCRLGLVGGEPMLRRDLPALVALAKARGMFVCVNTNLTLYGRHPERLAGVDHVFTSLDGAADAHEAARGAGSYAGVVDAIRDLVARGVPVVPICVVTEASLGEAEGLLRLAATLGVRVHFQARCAGGELARPLPDSRPADATLRAFFRRLVALKDEGAPIASSRAYLEELAAWDDFSRAAVLDPDARCAAGRGFLYVDPRGNAWACPYTRGKVRPVNLLVDDWRTAWDGRNPCTRCMIGPMVEFNLLYRRPLAAAAELFAAYGRG